MESSGTTGLRHESSLVAGHRLYGEIAPVCGHLNVAHAQLARLTVDVLATGAWGGAGIVSPERWLCLLAGLSRSRAAQIVIVAERWHELPVTMAAFASGELSIDQVHVVAKTVRSFNDAEACELARNALVGQLGYALRRYRYHPDPTPDEIRARALADADDHSGDTDADDHMANGDVDRGDDQASPDGHRSGADEPPNSGESNSGSAGDDGSDASGRGAATPQPTDARPNDAEPDAEPDAAEVRALAPNRVWFSFDDDGRYRVTFDLDALSGALVDHALREARNALFNDGRPSTWADALTEMATRSLAAVPSVSRRDLYRVYVHVDTEGAWINNGPAVPTSLFDKITCDGTVVLLAERHGRPVDVHRPTPVISNHLRRLVLDRDRCCRYPGCGRHAHLEAHHVIPRAELGHTTLANLAALCPLHHDLIHRKQLRLSGNADVPGGLRFGDPAGVVIHEYRSPQIPGDTPPLEPPPGHQWKHPGGERFHHDCLVFREPSPDYQPPPGDPPNTRPAAA